MQLLPGNGIPYGMYVRYTKAHTTHLCKKQNNPHKPSSWFWVPLPLLLWLYVRVRIGSPLELDAQRATRLFCLLLFVCEGVRFELALWFHFIWSVRRTTCLVHCSSSNSSTRTIIGCVEQSSRYCSSSICSSTGYLVCV